MFVIIVEQAFSNAKVIGPFDHEEQARDHAEKIGGLHIWRVTRLTPPTSKENDK